MPRSGPRATTGSRNCATRPARSSSSPTTSARSSRAATGSSGWRPARSCGTATTSRASSTSTWPPQAASPGNANRPGCNALAVDAAKGQPHDRATLGTGLGDNRAVLGEGEPSDDVEADPNAAEATAVAGLALHEALEDA